MTVSKNSKRKTTEIYQAYNEEGNSEDFAYEWNGEERQREERTKSEIQRWTNETKDW